jgi:hypothetical protein
LINLFYKISKDLFSKRRITKNNVVPILNHSGQKCKKYRKHYFKIRFSRFGINRTATLILCDLALAMASAENEVK